jgi:hypothetical protein
MKERTAGASDDQVYDSYEVRNEAKNRRLLLPQIRTRIQSSNKSTVSAIVITDVKTQGLFLEIIRVFPSAAGVYIHSSTENRYERYLRSSEIVASRFELSRDEFDERDKEEIQIGLTKIEPLCEIHLTNDCQGATSFPQVGHEYSPTCCSVER